MNSLEINLGKMFFFLHFTNDSTIIKTLEETDDETEIYSNQTEKWKNCVASASIFLKFQIFNHKVITILKKESKDEIHFAVSALFVRPTVGTSK